MNRIHYWIVVLSLLCAGCGNGDSSYVINGEVTHPGADGNIIYLSHSNGDELVNLDSAIIDDGKFTLHGVQEVPIMAYLRFKSPSDSLAVSTLFILENGTLSAHMDTLYSKVTGTPQNKMFEPFLRESHRLDSLCEREFENYLAQVESGKMDAATEQKMRENTLRWEREQARLAFDFIEKNSESPAALWLLETMQSQFSEEELRNLISQFNGLKRPPIVEEIAQRLRNAHKIEPGNPYIDIELINYRGKNRKLSNYVGYARYTAVGFWRNDSKPACRDMVTFAQLQQEFKSRPVTFLGVSLDENQEEWTSQPSDLKLTSSSQCRANLVDEVIDRYALVAVPSFLLIAPDGTIHSRNLSIEQLSSLLDDLFPYQESSDNEAEIPQKG